jgi:hypothetical protein
MRLFDEEIQPEIDSRLRDVDAGHCDIDLRLYMIGHKKETSRPTIIICCANSTVRKEAELCLRKSSLLQKYPGFGLGASSLPLEGLAKALYDGHDNEIEAGHLDSPSYDNLAESDAVVYALKQSPVIGRKLWVKQNREGSLLRRGTGGPVIIANGKLYQLTAGHVQEPEGSQPSWDDLHFDGQSDEEEEDDSGPDNDSTSRGSTTPIELSQATTHSFVSSSGLFDVADIAINESTTPSSVVPARLVPQTEESVMEQLLMPIGTIEANRTESSRDLDYALVTITDPEALTFVNVAKLPTNLRTGEVVVSAWAAIPAQEKPVVILTSSQGSMNGLILSSYAYFRPSGSTEFQKTYVLLTERELFDGDSGSAVVDSDTGDFYGQIVRGCPGTRVSYLISADDIFEDTQRKLNSPVSIPAAHQAIDAVSSHEKSASPEPSQANSYLQSAWRTPPVSGYPHAMIPEQTKYPYSSPFHDMALTPPMSAGQTMTPPRRRRRVDSTPLQEQLDFGDSLPVLSDNKDQEPASPKPYDQEPASPKPYEHSQSRAMRHVSVPEGQIPRLSKPVEFMNRSYDYVVIGSGYGGAVAASRMARVRTAGGKRKTVCVLERGQERWPGEYPSSYADVRRQLHVSTDSTTAGHSKESNAAEGDPTGMFHLISGNGLNAIVGNGTSLSLLSCPLEN